MLSFEIKYTTFFFGTLIFSLLINLIFLKFVKSLGIRNTVDTVIRWNEKSKPSIGGLSFYIIFLLSISIYSVAFGDGIKIFKLREIGILMACTLGFLMGLADDAYNTKPILKSLTQISCGVILVITGTEIQLFQNDIANHFLTIFWVMGIMNSVNMLDNMDGIAGTVSMVISLTLLLCLWFTDYTDNLYFILITGLFTSLTGFLYFNWHPAKMFMGDSGSQFLGSALAAFGIVFFWNLEPMDSDKVDFVKSIVIPVLAFIVPIADTTTVVINRISGGHSPFVGGKDHTTHNLARLGFGDSQVALIILIISAISAFLILFYYRLNPGLNSTGLILTLSYIAIVFLGLFATTRFRRRG